MSYTDEVINELVQSDVQKTCCRKAMIFGMMYGASREGEKGVRALFKARSIAERAAYILQKQFSAKAELSEITRAGRRLTELFASTKAIAVFLDGADGAEQKELRELVGFRCDECSHAFLCGVFMATATISDPKKSYHLEFSLPNGKRADMLAELLEGEIGHPGRVSRNGKSCVYYKRNALIGDLLYYVRAMKKGFEFSDDFIAHDIRNMVNRTTNCEAGNLARAVDAAIKQIEAINALKSDGALAVLGKDICYTAELRLENPEVSLTELAKLHEPPISRSMLNRRLTKIIKKYEAIK